MQEYSEVTPAVQLYDGNIDLDNLASSYINLKYGATTSTTLLVDSSYQSNLPGISYDFYGDTTFWRAILAYNGLNDPVSDICVGTTLILPDASSLAAFMAAQANNDQNFAQILEL